MEVLVSPASEDLPSDLQGYSLFNQNILIFDFGSVIVAKNYKEIDQVRLVSGGTISHIDYVGEGMLTASIQGQLNQVPTSNIILRTIRELSLNHVRGILIIVPANSTDVLSFGLATERAVNDDLKVMLLGVADDCKNNAQNNIDRKGLCGVVLIHKIAGALAFKNKSLPNIYEYCTKAIKNLISTGKNVQDALFFESCTYCKKCRYKVEPEKGLRKINREIKVADFIPDIVNDLLSDLMKTEICLLQPGDGCILLVNNTGALKRREEYIFIKEIWKYFKLLEVNIVRLYVGEYLYINDNIDLSMSVLKVFDNEIVPLLDFPCDAVGWKPVLQYESDLTENRISGCLRRKCRLSPPVKGPRLRDKPSNVVQLCLQFACNALISCEKMLNKIDAEKGDGDTGTRLRNVAEVLNKRACNQKLIFICPFTFFLSLSKILENAVGGTMGCIYSILFEAAANKFGEYKEDDEITYNIWVESLENACQAMEKYGNVRVGDKTMYDPLIACVNTIKLHLSENDSPIEAFGKGVCKAEETATKTVKAGCKYPDAGAHAVGIWLRSVYEGVKLRCE